MKHIPKIKSPSIIDVPTENVDFVQENDFQRGGWIVIARIFSQISQFLIVILAARFIAPSQFGTFALLSAIGVGLTRISEAGWREFIMATDREDALAEVHSLAFCSGIVIAAIGILTSFAMEIADIEIKFKIVMNILSIWVLFATLSAVQAGVLVRRRAFSQLAVSQIAGDVIGLIIAAAAFSDGWGILGLAVAKLITQLVVFLGSLIASRWFSFRLPSKENSRESFMFSMSILATRLIGYAHDNVALFTIGVLAGPLNAGLFRASGRLSGAMSDVINEPVRLLAWSILQRRNPKLAVHQLSVLAVLIATPLFLGLAVTAHDIIALFFGKEWAEASPLLIALSVGGFFSVLNVMTEPLLSCNGHVSLVPKISLAFTFAAMVVLVFSAPIGIFWIAIGQVSLAVISFPITLWIQHRYGGTSPNLLLREAFPAALGGVALVASVLSLNYLVDGILSGFVLLGSKVLVGAVGYVAVVILLVPVEKLRGKTATISAAESD